MAVTVEFVEQFARAMMVVERLLTDAHRLALSDPDAALDRAEQAKAVADEWNMHPSLRRTLSESAAENAYCGR